ncbi:MAG TPA: hypothetical protein VG102_03940 [Candidatus Paceibacterota bacterium]|jgi:hypothetical protein|nr:hypothetical protein [Candidatus Paceibacterota bacterium]
MRIVTLTLTAALAALIALPAQANGINPMVFMGPAMHMMRGNQQPQYGHPQFRPVYGGPMYRRGFEPRFAPRRHFVRRGYPGPLVFERRGFVPGSSHVGYGDGGNGGGEYGYRSGVRVHREWHRHSEWRHFEFRGGSRHFESRPGYARLAYPAQRQYAPSGYGGRNCTCCCCAAPAASPCNPRANGPGDPPDDEASPGGSNVDNVPETWQRVQ